MKKTDQHVLVMQVGDSEVKVYTDISDNDCVKILKKKALSIANNLETTNAKLSAARRRMSRDPDFTVEYYQLLYAQSQTDRLLNLDLDEMSSIQHGKRIDEYHRYASLGSALLYKDINFGGSSKFFTATWPNFKWSPYRFNDKASSAKAWGGNVIFQHSWYSGRKLYLIGIPYVEFSDFTKFDFNDIASSIITAL